MKTRLWLMILGTLSLTLSARAEEPARVAIAVSADQIEFRIGTEMVARYHKGSDVAKPYLWPVLGPGGVALTRSWPMIKGAKGESTDHPHQKSAWFCHGDVIPEGLALKSRIKGVTGVDFWSEAKGHGVIACTVCTDPHLAKDHGWIGTQNEWRTAEGEKILDESRKIYLYPLGQARLFVFDILLKTSTYPIVFGDTKEGSFGIRINDDLREIKGKGVLENATGARHEASIWGQKSAWCDYSGPLGDTVVGLAILEDPHNPPACWHSRGYGLMAANPFGRAESGFPAQRKNHDLFRLPRGESLHLRYGLLVHPGDAQSGKVAEVYQRFTQLREAEGH